MKGTGLPKLLIFLVSMTATLWLWGHWSLDQSMGLSLLLIGDSVLMVGLVSYPLLQRMKGHRLQDLLRSKLYQFLYFLYVGLTLLLCLFSFYGLIQYLLPIKVLLLALVSFYKYKKKSWFSKVSS